MEYATLSLVVCLAVATVMALGFGAARLDDARIRDMLQPRYDAASTVEALAEGKLRETDIQGRPAKVPYPRGLRVKVESADILDEIAKASVTITYKLGGVLVTRTELHKWAELGAGWTLVETHVTSKRGSRNGKVLYSVSERKLTDWQRSYGRNATWTGPRPHRSGGRSDPRP